VWGRATDIVHLFGQPRSALSAHPNPYAMALLSESVRCAGRCLPAAAV